MNQNPHLNDLSVNDRDKLLRNFQELEERCRRAEDSLRTLEQENRLLADSALFGTFFVDAEGRMLGANQKIPDMLVWPPSLDITRLNIFKHDPLVDSGVADAFRRCLEKRTRVTSDHSCSTGGEKSVHYRYHVSPAIDKDELLSGMIAFVEDVTELKLAEEAIKASEKKYRLLFEQPPWWP